MTDLVDIENRVRELVEQGIDIRMLTETEIDEVYGEMWKVGFEIKREGFTNYAFLRIPRERADAYPWMKGEVAKDALEHVLRKGGLVHEI